MASMQTKVSVNQMLHLQPPRRRCRRLRRDGGDAARALHDETHLHIWEAVLLGLGATLVCRRHAQVEAQRHGLLPQLGIPSEEGALPLFYHLIDLLRPENKGVLAVPLTYSTDTNLCVRVCGVAWRGMLRAGGKTKSFPEGDTPCPWQLARFHIKHKLLKRHDSHATLLMGTCAADTMLGDEGDLSQLVCRSQKGRMGPTLT